MSYSLSFSKAILVIVFIADKMRQGQHEFLSTASISQLLNIPKPTLVQIFKNLTGAGIIQTREGKHGGIRLLKEPNRISLLDIFQAIEQGKPLFNGSFDIMATGKRPEKAQEIVLELFKETQANMEQTLAAKTIGQILEEMSS